MTRPKILIFDIETAPIEAYVWGLWDQNVGLNQIKADWCMIAWAAKWLDTPASEVMYMDNRGARNVRNDKRLVKALAALINEADIVITQNGEKFDLRKLNARAAINRLPPIKPVKSVDILKEGRRVFSFTSHKLDYVTGQLNTRYKKLKHYEFPGFDLWEAVLTRKKGAWDVMKKYTIHDVLSTEETYTVIQGWIRTQNIGTWMDGLKLRCHCGSENIIAKGYAYTPAGKYQVYHCKGCGKWPRSSVNLLTKDARKNILRHNVRP